MISYDPKEATQSLIVPGQYDAEILTAEEVTSKKDASKKMLKLCFRVWAGGNTYQLFDYIVPGATIWKLNGIAKALGLLDKFEAKTLNERDMVGRSLRVEIKTQADKTGQYGDQSVIKKYLASESGGSATKSREVGADDEVAF